MTLGLLVLGACRDERLSAEALRDPAVCADCHPDHVREWSGSMHAYAGVDPVFLAMEAKGQRETDGALGDFCVRCHAPMAVADGLVATGADVADLPADQQGVTCAFCHFAEDVAGTHNNPVVLADDRVIRGPFSDPLPNPAHESVGSTLHDRDDPRSSALCGSCHDIVSPLDAHIERTYAEWQGSLFARPGFGLSCGACHLPRREGTAAADGRARKVHDHGFPGVDVALTPFPADDPAEQARQRSLVQELLDDSVAVSLCLPPPGGDPDAPVVATVGLENVAAGHGFPSGATADRRAWVTLRAWRGDELLYATGPDPGGEPVGRVSAADDPDLWRIWSTLLDERGAPTHDFWDAAGIANGPLLPVQTTLDRQDPAWVDPHVTRAHRLPAAPDRVELAVHLTPIGREILDDLVASGDLDPAVRDAMPTFTLQPTVVTWTPSATVYEGAGACVPGPPGGP
jgi:hypothetical protein